MASINCSDTVKEKFDEQQTDDFDTQGEFLSYLLAVERDYNGEPIDHDELADALSKRLTPTVEDAAYRGVDDFADWNDVVLVPREAVDLDLSDGQRVE